MHTLEVLADEVLAIERLLLVFAEFAFVAKEAHVLSRYMAFPFILTPEGPTATGEGEGTYKASVMLRFHMLPVRKVNP